MMFGFRGVQSRLTQILFTPIRTATKRASGGKSANNNTAGRRLGPKKGEGEFVEAGQILWRQRGTKWYPGENAGIGRDHTIFAKEPGFVRYYRDPFHPKRRFIGISLRHSDRLPTPHFEPRRRRFGFKLIENSEVSAFESEFLTRKETQAALALDKINAERDSLRQKRYKQYISVLESCGFKDSVQPMHYERLDSIYQFICGGMKYEEAVKTVDDLAKEDYEIACRSNNKSLEELKSSITEYMSEASKVDALVAFGAQRQLVAKSDLKNDMEAVTSKVAEITKPYMENSEGTPLEIVSQIENLLVSSPALSSGDIAHIKRRFLRRPVPIIVNSNSKDELESRVKNGEGKIQEVWDSESSGIKKYFVPTGAKIMFL